MISLRFLILISLISLINCSGQYDNLNIFIATKEIVKLDTSQIYLFTGYNKSDLVFRTSNGSDYMTYRNHSFFKLNKIVEGNLIFINEVFAVFAEKVGSNLEVKIKHANSPQKIIVVKDRIFFNIDQQADKLVFQEGHNPTIKSLDLNSDTIVKALGIKGFNPILRGNNLYFTRATQTNKNFSALSDLCMIDLTKPGEERTILTKIYEEGLEISSDKMYIITIMYSESGDYYTLFDVYKNAFYSFKDEKLKKYYPVFLNKKEIMFYNPLGLDYIIKEIPQ